MGTPSTTAPAGTVTSVPETLDGAYTRTVPVDALGPLELVQVDVNVHATGHTGEVTWWTTTAKIPAAGVLADTFSIPVPALSTNGDYCWRARVRDTLGNWSSWTARRTFTLSVAAPVLSIQRPPATASTLLSLTGFRVSAKYNDGEGNPPSRISFEVVAQVAAETWDAAVYDPDTNVWTYDGPPRDWDGTRVSCRYGGPALTEGATYLWRMAATSPFGATTGYVGGQFTLVDRTVPGSGPVETVTDTWKEVWGTDVVRLPVGLWYKPDDPDNIRVLDRGTRLMYTVRQSDRTIIGQYDGLDGVISYPAGLSGEPSDTAYFWVLEAPWTQGAGTSGNRVKKIRESDLTVVASWDPGDGQWSAIKVSASYVYLANFGTGEFARFNKTGTVLSTWQNTYESVLQDHPTGLMIDGTDLYLFYYNDGSTKRFLKVTEADLDTVVSATSTEGLSILGGEMDTTTHYDCFGDSDVLGRVWKFTLAEVQYSDGTAATRLRVAKTSYGDA